VFKFTTPTGPSIAVQLQDGLNFGTVCSGTEYLTLDVYNVGGADLTITSVQRLMGSTDFSVLATPAVPLTVQPGEDVTFTVAYTPSVSGPPETAIIRIASNDPGAPFVDVAATGIKGTGKIVTAIANSGSFGNICVGSHADEALTINNAGDCALSISSITSSSADFLAPSVISYPLVVAPGASTAVAIRFQPSSVGFKSGTITIGSDDPAGPHDVQVTGDTPPPRLALVMANSGSFGHCCVGSFKDEPLILSNSGVCTLSVTDITSSSGDFLVPEALSYPLTIEAGNSLEVPIRFQPTSFGAKTATITVTSDDPAGSHTIEVSGDAPPGKLAVTGSTYFGGVKCCRREFRAIAICNVGDCDLHVSEVAFKHKSRHWALVHNPFPATLHPGSCLNVTIRYKATQSEPRPCELLIKSDDPAKPIRKVEIIAWTRCCCKECCDECREHRHCEERHQRSCEEHHRRCCREREGEDRVDRRRDRREERHHEKHGHQREWREEDEEE
jgi:HYDIN/CFA65/VesB family protein/ASPM-SPD-2-Hydin domain-containing protein